MSWQLFDKLAAFFRTTNIYRSENLYSDQSSLARIQAAGEFLNFNTQHSLLEQTNLQINRLERYKDFDQMDEVGEIHLALDMYSDEASLIDPELKHSIQVKAKSIRVKKELDNFFYNTLMIDNTLRPAIRYLCKYGDAPFEIIPTQNRNGVAAIRHMNVYNFTRVETKYGDLVGYFHQEEMAAAPTFFHPWQIMHLRLTTFENIYHPYGRSILDGARKHFKQLRLMEDAAIVYRLTRAPEKRIFTIPVGNIPTKDIPQFIELIARTMKKKKFFDPGSGDVNERWHPLIQEDDFWLPQRADGTGPTVDTLPGAENLDQIADIEYFKKKMVAALKIPFSRVGIGDPSDGDQEPLSKVAPEFAKAMQWIQREIATGLKKIAIVHLALRGFSADDIRGFDLHMTASSAIDELYRVETWAARADVIDALKNTGMFPDEWILQRFTDMTLDEIYQMKDAARDFEAKEAAAELGGGPAAPEGEEAEGEGGLEAPPPPASAEDEISDMPLEGYDNNLEKQVISEAKRQLSNKSHVPDILKRFEVVKESHDNYFDYFLNHGELDHLGVREDDKTPGEPLIKRIIAEDVWRDAKKDMEQLLKFGQQKALITEDTEITEDDLPI
jgi:hypothetical protein